MGEYRRGVGSLLRLFYATLLAIDLYDTRKMAFPGLVLTAWVVGNLSEAIGSVLSRVWTFLLAPYYLLAGCWPLEIFGQYILSAFSAGESMDAHTSYGYLGASNGFNSRGPPKGRKCRANQSR
jgi:hypothetical protein